MTLISVFGGKLNCLLILKYGTQCTLNAILYVVRIAVLSLSRTAAGPRITLDFAKSLKQTGNLVGMVVCNSADVNYTEALGSTPITQVKTYTSFITFLWRIITIGALLKEINSFMRLHKPKIVIFPMQHILDPIIMTFLRLSQRKKSLKIVTYIHDYKAHPGDPQFLNRLLNIFALNNSHFLVSLSKTVEQKLRKDTKLPIIELNLPFSNIVEIAKRPKNKDSINILFLGRMRKYKGLERLSEVWNQYLSKDPKFHLIIAGEGEEKFIRSNFTEGNNCTLLLQYYSDDDKYDMIVNSDLVLLPYDEASQSGIINDAISCSVPFIVTPVEGLINQVKIMGGGFVARDMSANAFAERIIEFGHGRLTVESKAASDFSWTTHTKSLITKLQTLTQSFPVA